jgi:hypothetical protein
MSINTNSILVSLHIGKWEPVKDDKRISDDVNASHSASKKAGKYRKYLFPNDDSGDTFPELRAVLKALNTLYVWHSARSLVWNGKGQRLLPLTFADEHKTETDKLVDALPGMLDAMVAGYPAAIERAKVKLNGMFRQSDYPTSSELRDRFYVSCDYDAVPQVVTSNLPSSVLGLINSQIESRVTAATESAMNDAWNRLHGVVEKFQKTLASPGAIFRDTLVGNVREVCSLLTKLNVTGDATLESMRAKVENELSKYDPDTLRDNALLRENVAKTADNMLAAMRGTRKLSRVED